MGTIRPVKPTGLIFLHKVRKKYALFDKKFYRQFVSGRKQIALKIEGKHSIVFIFF